MDIKTFEMGSLGTNCYLVKVDGATVVVDPFDIDPKIEEFLGNNLELEKYVLLTHCHFDHILGANKLREKFGAKIIIGEYDAEGLSNTSISLSRWMGFKQEPFTADILAKDGEILKLGNTETEVVHTPGHTAGSVCYKFEDAVFTGDTLFKGSIGRTDLPTGNYDAIIDSLKKLKNTVPKDTVVYPGHGPSTTMEQEIQNNPYLLKDSL